MSVATPRATAQVRQQQQNNYNAHSCSSAKKPKPPHPLLTISTTSSSLSCSTPLAALQTPTMSTSASSNSTSSGSSAVTPLPFSLSSPHRINRSNHNNNLHGNNHHHHIGKRYHGPFATTLTWTLKMIFSVVFLNAIYQYIKQLSQINNNRTSDYAAAFFTATSGGLDNSAAASSTNAQLSAAGGTAGNALSWTPSTSSATRLAVPFPYEKAAPQTTAVFFHIFIPPTSEGRQNAARIIQEQFQQLAAAASASHETYTVYYNTVGDLAPGELSTSDIRKWCNAPSNIVDCHPLHHYPEGMEDKTLQRLYEFCSDNNDDRNANSNNDVSVVYLHNKGSYTHKPINEAWRYQMTQAVTSPQCQQATSASSTSDQHKCNLCGLYFSVERGMFMAGNMWRSQCSYIRQLLPPQEFPHAMHAVTAHALLERLRYKLLMTLQELRAGVFGIDRFATEFWVASHPTVRPCDFSNVAPPLPNKPDLTDQFLNWLRQMGDAPKAYQQSLKSEWFVQQAPGFPLPLPSNLQVVKFPDVRLREYFLLAGNLFKWYFLYQQAPPSDSWVYKWFPDGDTWRKAVQEHGPESVNVITNQALKEEVASGRNRYTRDNTKKKPNIQQKPSR